MSAELTIHAVTQVISRTIKLPTTTWTVLTITYTDGQQIEVTMFHADPTAPIPWRHEGGGDHHE